MFQSFVKNFFRGLMFVVPAAVTIYIVYFVFVTVDNLVNLESLLNRRIPGVGFLITVALITLVGFLAGNIATRWMFGAMDRVFMRVPLLKLVYTSLRDMIEAFVGDRKRFDKPVLVSLGEESSVSVPGFLTRENLAPLGLEGYVAVYFPQSYNFAGNLLVVPMHRVRPLGLESTAAMTFIVSGGVSGELPHPKPEGAGKVT